MLTPKQQQVLLELEHLPQPPTVRALADHMEARFHRSERWTDHEIRGLLERLISTGHVSKFRGKRGEVRYQTLGDDAA